MKGRDFHDVQFYFHEETQAAEKSLPRQIQAQANFHAINEHIVKNATEAAEQAHYEAGDLANSQRLRGIRDNRAKARDKDRQDTSWNLSQDELNDETKPANDGQEAVSTEEEKYITPISQANKIRKIRKQKKEITNE